MLLVLVFIKFRICRNGALIWSPIKLYFERLPGYWSYENE